MPFFDTDAHFLHFITDRSQDWRTYGIRGITDVSLGTYRYYWKQHRSQVLVPVPITPSDKYYCNFSAFLNRHFPILFCYLVWFLIYLIVAHLNLIQGVLLGCLQLSPSGTTVNLPTEGNINWKIDLQMYRCVSETIEKKNSFSLLLSLHFSLIMHSYLHPFPAISASHLYFYVGKIYQSHNVSIIFSGVVPSEIPGSLWGLQVIAYITSDHLAHRSEIHPSFGLLDTGILI